MSLSGSLGILKFALFLLVAVLIVIAVFLIGGALVAVVSLPVFLILPRVRRHFSIMTENMTDVRPESITNWRFGGVYLLFLYVYGFALLIGPAMLAESTPIVDWLLPLRLASVISILTIFTLVGVGILLAVPWTLTWTRLRTGGEWLIFLCIISILTGVAAFFVPIYLFRLLQFLL